MNNSEILPLREDQIQDLAKIIKAKKLMNLSDPGAGKTPVANMLAYYLWHKFQQKTVFVMPLSIQNQNKKSFFKFTHFKEEDIIIVRGTLKQRQKLMSDPKGKVFIVGFDFFKPLITKKTQREADWDFLTRHHPNINCCMVDEFHMGFSNIKAKRTLFWLKAMSTMEYFHPMTGTLIDGKLSTAYPALHVIEPRYYFNYNAFLREHAVLDYWGNIEDWVRVDKFKTLLDRHSIRHSFEEIHGKDNILLETEYIEMGKKHREMYDEFEETHMIELDKEFLEAASGGVAALRLRQIMQCPDVIDSNWKGMTAKEEALERHMLNAYQAGKKLLVFGSFIEEVERLKKVADKLKFRAGVIHSKVSPKQRDRVDTQFINGELDMVLATPGTTGVGFDWDFVDYMVFSCLSYKDSDFSQGYRRAIRGAREHPLLCYVLEYEKSRDQQIAAIVEHKMKLSAKVQKGKTVFNLTNKKPKPSDPNRKAGQKLSMSALT